MEVRDVYITRRVYDGVETSYPHTAGMARYLDWPYHENGTVHYPHYSVITWIIPHSPHLDFDIQKFDMYIYIATRLFMYKTQISFARIIDSLLCVRPFVRDLNLSKKSDYIHKCNIIIVIIHIIYIIYSHYRNHPFSLLYFVGLVETSWGVAAFVIPLL